MTTNLIGSSSAIAKLKETIAKIAPTNGRVLITGENGTGKELVVHALHVQSRRADRALVTLNCAAVPSELIESELFGHERGSFTGAVQARLGKFEAADGGTLFLDEVGDMPQSMQAKLLRVLQTGEVTRVGATASRVFDVRVFAATNRDLLADVESGKFRQDLYYRLNVVHVEVPALRDHPSDIPLLAESFMLASGERNHKVPPVLMPSAMALLEGQQYPGNVRELQNICERIVVMCDEAASVTALDIVPFVPNAQVNVAMLSRLELDPSEVVAKAEHGTYAAYNTHGCRCELCRAANSAYAREYRARRRAEKENEGVASQQADQPGAAGATEVPPDAARTDQN